MSGGVGLATGGCNTLSILDTIDAAAGCGVAGLEIGTPPRHFDVRQPAQIDAVTERLRRHHLRAVSIHAPFGAALDLADPQEAHRRGAIGAISAAALAIKRLGGHIVVVHPSDLPRHAHDVPARLADSARGLAEVSRSCRQENLTLAIESPLPHLIGGHPDEFQWLLNRVADAGVCLDTGHIALGRQWDRFLAVSTGRLVHVHVSDNHGHRDDHLPPGDGTLDWHAIGQSLRDVDYRGWLMLELGCPHGHLPQYFRRAVMQAGRLLGV